MEKFYVTGSTAGLSHNELNLKFKPTVDKILEMGAKCCVGVNQLITEKQSFKTLHDLRIKEIAKADCVVFFHDFKDTIESHLEFVEANRLGKHIRMVTNSDLYDIKRTIEANRNHVLS
jgi:hypothetical protein